jgi:hypothetical protein
VDTVIWCATDFNGNAPRAVSSLNLAFLFRAVTAPSKGRVEIEGLQNMLGALKNAKQDRKWKQAARTTSGSAVSARSEKDPNEPIDFVLVSMCPEAYENFETPFGEFNAIKRQAEVMLATDFPSLSHTTLQFGRFDDNFLEEGSEITVTNDPAFDGGKECRLINRRDAARAAVEAIINPDLKDKSVQVYTAVR